MSVWLMIEIANMELPVPVQERSDPHTPLRTQEPTQPALGPVHSFLFVLSAPFRVAQILLQLTACTVIWMLAITGRTAFTCSMWTRKERARLRSKKKNNVQVFQRIAKYLLVWYLLGMS